jgi:hypothetical protein
MKTISVCDGLKIVIVEKPKNVFVRVLCVLSGHAKAPGALPQPARTTFRSNKNTVTWVRLSDCTFIRESLPVVTKTVAARVLSCHMREGEGEGGAGKNGR